MGQIILGIVLFALVTAVLYVWGLKKSMTQQEDLDRALLRKSAERVNRYLKAHDTIDRAEMARLVEGVRAGLFSSRSRAGWKEVRSGTDRVYDGAAAAGGSLPRPLSP